MKKSSNGDLLIAVVIIIAATILAVLRYLNDNTVDALLWSIVALATLLREVRRYRKNRE